MDPPKDSMAVSVPLPLDKTDVTVNLVGPSGEARQQLVNPRHTTKISDPSDLVELARQVQKSEEFVRARAVGRLEIIAEQMKQLQAQAKRVLEEGKRDDYLHHIACNMKKVPGKVYYLYEKPNGVKYMSILSPQEWGPSNPNKFHGGFKLEADNSWTPYAQIAKREQEIGLMDKILRANKAMSSGVPMLMEVDGPMPCSGIPDYNVEEPN